MRGEGDLVPHRTPDVGENDPVLRTIGKRLLLLIPTLLGLSILLFLWVRALPGGPAVALLGEKATPEAIERINELYGFNQPILQQYFTWMSRLLVGDFQQFAHSELVHDVVTRPITVENGHMPVPQGPGLGLELDEAMLERARIDA